MTDRFSSRAASLEGPATHGFDVTPSDDGALSETSRALYVGTAGTLAVTFASGASLVFPSVAGGAVLPLRVTHVLATGTTAAGIIALV